MRAFLSHSSKDKAFVSQVANALGDGQCEYDERSFDYTMNVHAIRDALERSDAFVYFLSERSISSSFVGEEQRTALERRGAGFIKRVLIFALDETSYRALPPWLREINVVQRLSSPKVCARKIQAALVQLEAEDDLGAEVYLGRDKEDKELAKILSGAPATTPIAVHAVGHYGVGRKTFLRHNLHKLFPRRFSTFPEISIPPNQGIEELYRQLHDIALGGSIEDTLRDIENFAKLDRKAQVTEVARLVQHAVDAGEFLIIIDDGGVYDEDSDYQPHIGEVLEKINGHGLPALGVVQTRMMRPVHKQKNKRTFHIYITTLDDDSTRQLLGLTLKQLEIDYTDQQISDVCSLLDGHPFNVKFAAAFACTHGLEILIADPSDLVDWKRRRAEDFLKDLTFSQLEGDILAALDEYRYLASEMIFSVVDSPMVDTALALRKLQEFCCVERRDGYNHIAPPLRDAIRRDPRFSRPDSWKQNIGRKICDAIAEYHNDDRVTIAILDGATLAAARGHEAPAFLSALILPSHLLRIARDHYVAGKRALCIEFCERAWRSKERLPYEGQLEVLRLWGLSAVRIGSEDAYSRVIDLAAECGGKTAERIRLFLEGFYLRVNKRPDEAEAKFLAAWKLAPRNQSINRELADLLRRQRRYEEAERFARGAYRQEPANPFVIDVMVDVLIGKRQQGLQIDHQELARLMSDLERYGDAPGSSFFLVRTAQSELSKRNYREAIVTCDRAVERTPGLVAPYFIRADARIGIGDVVGAERDAEAIQRLLDDAGGFSEGDEARLQELEIRILIEKRQYRQAKDKVDHSFWVSYKVVQRILSQIEQAVIFDTAGTDEEMRQWALKRSKARGR